MNRLYKVVLGLALGLMLDMPAIARDAGLTVSVPEQSSAHTGIKPSVAQDVEEIHWKDLIPPLAAYDDPFLALSVEQKFDLVFIARARTRHGDSSTSDPVQDDALKAATARLMAANVNIDALLAKRSYVAAKRREAAEAVNESLNGRLVQIHGYVLPLRFEDKKVTEFLLVPYVGACIHEPVPQPNQIIHVTHANGFEPRGRFAAVVISGRIRAARSTPHLWLFDGGADVSTAYVIDTPAVEPYSDQAKPALKSLWRDQSIPAIR